MCNCDATIDAVFSDKGVRCVVCRDCGGIFTAQQVFQRQIETLDFADVEV